MNSSTIDHDCCLEDNIVLSSNVILGGNVYIMNGAQLGIKTIIHQNQVIGSYTMIGMGSIVTKKKEIVTRLYFFGKPIKKKGINKIGLKRNMISKDRLKKEVLRFNDIKRYIKMIKKLSIIVPVFNEANNISKFLNRLYLVLKKINLDYEIIFVLDPSSDNTEKNY